MKIDKMKNELAHMSEGDLKEKLESFRRELFSLKLNASTAHIKDYSSFKKLRKDIARGLTALRQKQQKGN
jgi:ribosomal protein L29